jgi:DNA (cytosine-5)-methyltransferase 1
LGGEILLAQTFTGMRQLQIFVVNPPQTLLRPGVPDLLAEARGRLGAPGSATVVDLFSGAGGMSAGFAMHPAFRIVGAADAEIGKPSSGAGTLGCNLTYEQNIGVAPLPVDLAHIDPHDLREQLGLREPPTVVLACAPCTGFSRALPANHLVDDARNSLVGRVGDFVAAMAPQVLVMENARELLTGRFSRHFDALQVRLKRAGYAVAADTHLLTRFGLPQRRERALVIAVKAGLPLLDLDDLWQGHAVAAEATHVRHAIADLPAVPHGQAHPTDPWHVSPRLISALNRARLAAIPSDGGSWADLVEHPESATLLTPSMKRRAVARDFGSHPDVYGRLEWDRPAATIKRECGHIGNGRYAHPEQDRLCTVREMALLQGFPRSYVFDNASLTNMYRHVGDAVPPLISYQLAHLTHWILSGSRPEAAELALAGTSLAASDIVET